uniref:ZP domain-containing protein n=1 Tax=Heterorhabditis bacteriophora TaxID=37862 RepID=A0A1I7WSQ5_HETBA
MSGDAVIWDQQINRNVGKKIISFKTESTRSCFSRFLVEPECAIASFLLDKSIDGDVMLECHCYALGNETTLKFNRYVFALVDRSCTSQETR